MAEITSVPLLSMDTGDERALTTMEQINLSQMTQHPGFTVLVKMLNTACYTATQDVIRLDPEEKGYQQVLMSRQTRARNINEFSALVLNSIRWHIQKSGVVQAPNTVTTKEELPSKVGRFVGPSKGK